MSIPIKRTVERVPGGWLLAGLFVGSLFGTFAPNTGEFFGSFTGGIFDGTTAIFGIFYFMLGSTISFRSLPYIAGKGGALLGAKLATAAVIGIVVGHFLGEAPIETGVFAGLSTLAIVAAMSDTNGILYLGLVQQFRPGKDAGTFSLLTLESGPLFTMIVLGLAGLSGFPWQNLLGAILPLIGGMILGNLDPDISKWFKQSMGATVPFSAFALGTGIDLGAVVKAGGLGIALGIAVFIVTGGITFLVDRVTRGDGVAGLAAGSTAGNAAAVPAVIGGLNATYKDAAGPATVLVSASVVVTAILVSVFTPMYARRLATRNEEPAGVATKTAVEGGSRQHSAHATTGPSRSI